MFYRLIIATNISNLFHCIYTNLRLRIEPGEIGKNFGKVTVLASQTELEEYKHRKKEESYRIRSLHL